MREDEEETAAPQAPRLPERLREALGYSPRVEETYARVNALLDGSRATLVGQGETSPTWRAALR